MSIIMPTARISPDSEMMLIDTPKRKNSRNVTMTDATMLTPMTTEELHDQAFAITAGLVSSYIVGIMLLPVLYCIVYRHHHPSKRAGASGLSKAYTHIFDFCFRHKVLCMALTTARIRLPW